MSRFFRATSRVIQSNLWRHSRLVGYGLGIAVVTNVSYKKSYCDAIQVVDKTVANVPARTIKEIVPKPDESGVVQTIKKIVKDAYDAFRYFARFLQYCLYGAPLVVMVPIAMIGVTSSAEEAIWNYLIWAIEQLGPAFIKLAQWASSRPDLYPPKLIKRLQRLQDDVTVRHSMATVDQTLTASFGPDWKDNLELDPKPIGAGCIAQVFRGKLRTVKKASDADSPVYKSRFGLFSRRRRTLLKGSSNEDDTALVATETPVAVKLIHPHVESLIKIDMEMLNLLANFMDRFPMLELLSIGDTCRQFAEMMKDQLDLRNEAYNLRKFASKFANEKWVVFPAPMEGYACKNALVESFMDGTPLNTILINPPKGEVGDAAKKLRLKLSDLSVRAMLKMIFFDNFVHGDLHPGNVMVQFSSSGDPRFVFLDCGLVFRTKSEEAHQALIDICIAFMKHDGLSAGRLMVNKHLDEAEKLKLAAMTPDQRETYDKQQQKRSDEFCKGLQTMIDETEHVKFFEHFGQYVNRICDLAREYRVKLDPDYFHVAMVLKVAEGMALSLNRELDMITTCIPIVVKAQAMQRLGITKFPLPGDDDDE